jgi:ABC-type Mn2+/Zn2+ transport system ATPase subunit
MAQDLTLSFANTYKSIKNFTTVTLPQLTVVSGPNGSGKTPAVRMSPTWDHYACSLQNTYTT